MSEQIASSIAHFFQTKNFTTSYKPIVFLAFIHAIRNHTRPPTADPLLIPTDAIAFYFLKFNYTLFKRFRLKQINQMAKRVDIYNIIEQYFGDSPKKKLTHKDMDPRIGNEVKTLLNRHVILLLRKDMPIYDFYNAQENLIPLKVEVKDEQEFRSLINPAQIAFLGVKPEVEDYIRHHYPILEKAALGVCTEFLETFNTVPKLYSKLLVAADSFHALRNIPDKIGRAHV